MSHAAIPSSRKFPTLTPVSPYLRRFAAAMLAGAVTATALSTVAPSAYYDFLEWPLFESDLLSDLRLLHPGATPATIVSAVLMPFFVLLVGKELWEAVVLERGGLHGRHAVAPLAMAVGGILGAILVWLLLSAGIETAEEGAGAPGWAVPISSDIVLIVLFGRAIFGKGHSAIQVLMFLTAMDMFIGLVTMGLAAPLGGTLRPVWLILPLLASMVGYVMLTRPLHRTDITEVRRQRASHIWPWLLLGLVSWIGVSAAGLPPALGLLPILPAMPHSDHSFGLFAEAEGLLSDPLNRLARVFILPLIFVMFFFGLTRGGMDFAALAPTTFVALGAFWIGKPLGVLAGMLVIRAMGYSLPLHLTWHQIGLIALLMGIGFTVPTLAIETALPGGAMEEAARLGLGASLVAGPAAWLMAQLGAKRP